MPDKLMLYHGTDCLFDQIDLSKSRDKRDFGIGFYTTTFPSQAESWAASMKARRGSSSAYVYEFEFDRCDELDMLAFEGLTVEWLDFVRDNRVQGGLRHSHDVVMGPVANDNTLLTVSRYVQGVYDAEEAIKRLQYFKVNDQVSFHTSKAVACLRLARRYEID